MAIAQETTIQAYQLRSGGTRARMAVFRMIAADSQRNRNESTRLQPGDWRGARSYTLGTYAAAYGSFSQGGDGWYSHQDDAPFRDEREAGDILRGHMRGARWYTDVDGHDTAHGIVCRLSHGRFIAGYTWSSNGERVFFPQVFDDETDAARAADGHAESFAESARDDSERFNAMSLAEFDVESQEAELQKAIALRSRSKFGGRDRVRDCIERVRSARDSLADATRVYERGV